MYIDQFVDSIEIFPLANDIGANGNSLTLTNVTLRSDATGTISFDTSGRVVYTPQPGDYNLHVLLYSATDSEGNVSGSQIAVYYSYTNQSPTLSVPSYTQITENSAVLFGFSANDIENDDINVTVSGGADSALFGVARDFASSLDNDGQTRFDLGPLSIFDFEFPSDANNDNIYEIELTATDSDGATDVRAIQIEIIDGKDYVITDGPDLIEGTSNSDFWFLKGGDDTAYGGLGNDAINGEAGNDFLVGNEGNDTLFGRAGNNRLFGNEGNDDLYDGDGDDLMFGGDGDDFLKSNVGNDTLHGNDGDDFLYAFSGVGSVDRNKLYGGSGNDTLTGGYGDDVMFGDAGDDVINSRYGNDQIWGGVGNDSLSVGFGDSTLDGGAGDDTLNISETGNHKARGGDGNDNISSTLASGDLVIHGGNGDDTASAGAGTDRLYGEAGNDRLEGGNGNDLLNGGADNDTLNGQNGDDRLLGGSGNDNIFGVIGDDTLFGNSGDDSLDGSAGVDRLDGGTGNDTMTGGADEDTFIIAHYGVASDGDIDTITDLNLAEDDLIIRAFNGNAQTRVDDAGELFALNLTGLMITDNGAGTMLTFDEGDGTSHQVLLWGVYDPLSLG